MQVFVLQINFKITTRSINYTKNAFYHLVSRLVASLQMAVLTAVERSGHNVAVSAVSGNTTLFGYGAHGLAGHGLVVAARGVKFHVGRFSASGRAAS